MKPDRRESPVGETPEQEIDRVLARLRAGSERLRGTTAAERAGRLRRLEAALLARREAVHRALHADFRKPGPEVDLTEIGPVLAETRHARRHLGRWMRPRRVRAPWLLAGTRSEVRLEPKGVVLVVGPWNYPVLLTLGPLVAAVAAGNAVVVKPSEQTPATARLIADVVAGAFAGDEVAVVQGGAATAERLLARPFDHVYFTGSTAVGRRVMRAAAEHPCSVTLELGGKSPALVDAGTDLRHAAGRLVWAKYGNAGQTCIAPDYVLAHASVHEALLRELVAAVERAYGATPAARRATADYARQVGRRHAERLQRWTAEALEAGARLVLGGEVDPEARYVAPTVLADVPLGATLMQEEIFGPVLPVLRYHHLSEALAVIRERPPALVAYVFGGREAQAAVLRETRTGAVLAGETLLHFVHPGLPFGGRRESGVGRGHGRAGFLAFSEPRAVLRRRWGAGVLRLVQPPYGAGRRALMRRLLALFGR